MPRHGFGHSLKIREHLIVFTQEVEPASGRRHLPEVSDLPIFWCIRHVVRAGIHVLYHMCQLMGHDDYDQSRGDEALTQMVYLLLRQA